MKTWIIGCGHIGLRVNKILQKDNANVFAIKRKAQSKFTLENRGITTICADLDDKKSLQDLPIDNDDIFYFAPPSTTNDHDNRMSNFLQSLNCALPPRRIVYISTTGVYGNSKGEWVNEETTPSPQNTRSKRRLNAEQLLQSFCKENKTQYVILRVAGIYSEEKLPLNKIKAGVKVLGLDIAPASNRIHSADLATTCIKAMQSAHENQIFNVADGQPSSISDYFIQTAKIFNLPSPTELNWQQAETELSPEMLSYLTESKKIDNRKMLKSLNVQLLYPNLSDGLIACKKALIK